MKTKIIPFDLETAKKIQAGEIEGKIKTRENLSARVICCDRLYDPYNIVALVSDGNNESVNTFTNKGLIIKDTISPTDLVLEVQDIYPQFKVGDKVRVRPNDTHSQYVKQYDNCIGKIVGENDGCFVVIVTGAFQDQFKAEELELIEETGKHEFKPFDKVLVRNQNKEGWLPSFYATKDGLLYYTIDCKSWRQCTPYEGNEHLVGTTDKSREE